MQTKTSAFPLATSCLILPHSIQVSRGELAGPLSNSVQIKYRIRSHVLYASAFGGILSSSSWGNYKTAVFHTAADKADGQLSEITIWVT